MHSDDVDLVTPVFQIDLDQFEIVLGESIATAEFEGGTYSGMCSGVLTLAPKQDLTFGLKLRDLPTAAAFSGFLGSPDWHNFVFNNKTIPGFPLGLDGNMDDEVTLNWAPKSLPTVVIGDEETKINNLIFHLFNFKQIASDRVTTIQCGNSHHQIEYFHLRGPRFDVRLNSCWNCSDAIKRSKRDRIPRMTHVGCIENSDGSDMTGGEARRYMKLMDDFLSFVKGIRSYPHLAVGFDSKGDRVWEAWSRPQIEIDPSVSWHDERDYEGLNQFFSCYQETVSLPVWERPIHEAIYWFLRAAKASSGIDGGIILTQAAIELLAYIYAVEDKKLISRKGFKKLWASDAQRLLFRSIGIPTEIPSECPEIQRLATEFKWEDLPQALTEIRNSLVHPDHSTRGKVSAANFESWKVGLWCLELAILRICGFHGRYSNRLRERMVGETEVVPWDAD